MTVVARAGLAALQDTTNDRPSRSAHAALPQLSDERGLLLGGQMLWLEVEGKLRELCGNDVAWMTSHVRSSASATATGTSPVHFNDVVATLNGIAPYDWATFLRGRLDGHGSLTGGLELAGGSWSTAIRRTMPTRRRKNAQGGIAGVLAGCTVLDSGVVGDVIWTSPRSMPAWRRA